MTSETNVGTVVASRKPSLIDKMAGKYSMEPAKFAETVRKTAMPAGATNEEFAAFLMVAHEYSLNPILKEIHAFPKKGGGIQPIVSLDGWVSLINQHPLCNGYDFTWKNDPATGDPISCTCTMHRKDRAHPVVVEEFLAECIRQTEPWRMKHRMLRHRALIQAARYCFGFSGLMDAEEAETVAEMKDVTPPSPPEPEFGAADAYSIGQQRRTENLPRRAPLEMSPEHQEIFLAGWDDADGELQEAAKA